MDKIAKITAVRAHLVAGFFDWVIVEVSTDAGITGWGEASTDRGVAGAIVDMRETIMGEDATNMNLVLTKLRRRWSGSGSRTGAFVGALSGIEMALWDIKGKVLGVPVHHLLGGKLRDQIELYIDCHVGTEYSPKGFRERALEVMDMSFRALKFDLDEPVILKSKRLIPEGAGMDRWNARMPPAARRYKAKLVEAVREAVGEEVEVGIDFHWFFPPADIRKFAKLVAPYDIAFFEDPVYSDNVTESLRDLSGRIDIPLLYGEQLFHFTEFQQVIESQAVAILAPEIARCGGISQCVEVARFADRYGILMSPHNVNSMIATTALAHVAAVIPNLYYVEYRYREATWWDALVSYVDGKSPFDRNRLNVPAGPGLGIEVNRKLLEEKTTRVV
jgi:L-alanine-DL-glutamate epimerase-like enolase superfamily enzyme